MRVAILWIIVLFPILISSTDFETNEIFHEGSMMTIKNKAAVEGKLYFIDFYADWCASCQLMEETTFQNKEVVKMLKTNYIGTKVNIENFDGIALKELYDIYILPTILIFNSKGELVERIEKAMQPSELMPILNLHNTPYNKEVTKKNLPKEPMVVAEGDIDEAPSFVEENTNYTNTNIEVSMDELNTQYSGSTIPENISNITQKTVTNNLFELEVKTFDSKGYSVRMGSFSNYKDMLAYAKKIEEIVVADKFINIKQVGETVTFELYFGLFEYAYGAEDFNDILGLDFEKGEVVDLNTLE